MRIALLILLFSFVGCTTLPDRYIASESMIILGDVNASNSTVKLFQPKNVNLYHHPSFYFKLRADNNELVDVDDRDFVLKIKKKIIRTKVSRLAQGKYEVEILDKVTDISSLQIWVQHKRIKHSLKLLTKPSKENSKFTLIENENNNMRLQLELKDKKGADLEPQHPPEIILEGIGQVTDLQRLGTGIWEVALVYPEMNQIFYFSVRVNGVLLERMFRYQHVEK